MTAIVTTVIPTVVTERLLTPSAEAATIPTDTAGDGTVTVQLTMPRTISLEELTRTTHMTTTVLRTVTNTIGVILTSVLSS